MLCLWLGLCALDFSPELHRRLHQDAQSPSHNCLVTQLQSHLLLPVFVASLLPAAPEAWALLVPGDVVELPLLVEYLVSDGRAPPAIRNLAAVVG